MINLQERGILFVEPTTEVYEGMIVGENSRADDMDVNITKEKKLTNMRSATSDNFEKLDPAAQALASSSRLEFCREDECVEVTPRRRSASARSSSTRPCGPARPPGRGGAEPWWPGSTTEARPRSRLERAVVRVGVGAASCRPSGSPARRGPGRRRGAGPAHGAAGRPREGHAHLGRR